MNFFSSNQDCILQAILKFPILSKISCLGVQNKVKYQPGTTNNNCSNRLEVCRANELKSKQQHRSICAFS